MWGGGVSPYATGDSTTACEVTYDLKTFRQLHQYLSKYLLVPKMILFFGLYEF